MSLVTMYVDLNDWWIGCYRGPLAYYVCILPTVVIRIRRKRATVPSHGQ